MLEKLDIEMQKIDFIQTFNAYKTYKYVLHTLYISYIQTCVLYRTQIFSKLFINLNLKHKAVKLLGGIKNLGGFVFGND